MKKLTSSVYTFADLIADDFLYVDKTEFIWKLVSRGKGLYFLSPRAASASPSPSPPSRPSSRAAGSSSRGWPSRKRTTAGSPIPSSISTWATATPGRRRTYASTSPTCSRTSRSPMG